MCGLAGFYPKKGKKVNINKLYLLGIINEDRGTDSCGLSIADTRFTGTNLEKKARDFIASEFENIEKIPLLNKPCIFHTRKGTIGTYNVNNCHPFVYKSSDGLNHFSLAHNGTLSNMYDIKREFLKDVENVDEQLHIDSHYLAMSLGRALSGKADEADVLKFYKGYAALLYYTNNCFKAWKGANNDTEERPLYYVETPSGWYFSSIKNALYLVFDRLYKVQEVQNNELLTFHNYALEKSEIIVRNHEEKTTYYNNNYLGWDYTAPKIKATSGVVNHSTNVAIIKNITEGKTFNDSPVAHPRINLHQCRYTDMNLGKPLEGEYKCVLNPNTAMKEMYALFSKKSSYTNKILFVDGIIVKDKHIYNAIRGRFYNKSDSADKFFNSEQPRLLNTVIDFIPFFKERQLHTVVYKKTDGTLDYITKFDDLQVTIRPLFGPTTATFVANGESLSIKTY